ncbi:MAG: hypothetical protein WDM89_03900 [Rhizomicrobium sp.]
MRRIQSAGIALKCLLQMGGFDRGCKVFFEAREVALQRASPRDQNIVMARLARKGKDCRSRSAKSAFCPIAHDSPAQFPGRRKADANTVSRFGRGAGFQS